MSDKKIYTIDGNDFSTEKEFYDTFSINVLGEEVGWGHNLDAFDDVLRGGFGTPDEGFVFIWKNSDISKEKLGYGETVKWLEDKLIPGHAHPSWELINKMRLEDAKNRKGKTRFDKLVEIIRDHEDIELRME